MEIPVVKLDDKAVIPTKAHKTDAGWDLYSIEDVIIDPGARVLVSTGISMAIPAGFAGLIWPRSGLSVKSGIDVLAGVVDHGYTGEIRVCLLNTTLPALTSEYNKYSGSISYSYDFYEGCVGIKCGDRIAQLVIQPILPCSLKVSETLPDADRGSKGFGSSGQ